MTNTRTKKHGFKNRIIAGILSVITIVSVGAATMTSASAAEKDESIATKITSTVTDYFKDKAIGVVKSSALKVVGSALTQAGLGSILSTYLGFEVPAGKKVYIEMTGWSNGFDAYAKSDMPIFTVGSNSDLTVRHAEFKGGTNHVYVPDSAKNAHVTIFACDIYRSNGPAVLISSKADNTKVNVQWSEYWNENNGFVKNNSKTSTVNEDSCKRAYQEDRGDEYWGS